MHRCRDFVARLYRGASGASGLAQALLVHDLETSAADKGAHPIRSRNQRRESVEREHRRAQLLLCVLVEFVDGGLRAVRPRSVDLAGIAPEALKLVVHRPGQKLAIDLGGLLFSSTLVAAFGARD